ncbi:MAG: serine/threonine protein kinase [Gammaproteobacteria bacterium]|jgi:Ser/Thr protein kinase RdoA (MazF antagonist)|nr:serine/threonine protein kinase [Gammaproteobacteria bacterium]MBT3858936.1 serine/threonine protein kinase [Gammaproteobacteria bacterium]MBT3988264.1 serine/threonine protein kinase [Gammaproteobacteria bacterium]MBT4256874.1 serine/threonine protein kinase [Gammaproteobacteria bacterium]MBT4582534.1 serine/threonine protein kinase [Gammaproteobacteria bacterium]
MDEVSLDSSSSENHPYTELTPDSVLEAVEALGYETDARVFALNSYENRVYQIGVFDQPSIIVKFYRPGGWTNEQIHEEHNFTRELVDLDIPVIPPLDFGDKGSLLQHGNFRFSVFEQFAGRPPELDNLDNLLVMGRFVGRLHAVGAMSNFKHRVELSIERLGVSSRAYLLENNFIPKDLVAAYESLSSDLVQKIEGIYKQHGEFNHIRIHGDCHTGNVLWRGDTPHFVDFDDTMNGPAIQDLWMMLSGDRNQRQAQLLELVEGYNEFHNFRASELQIIESLRTLRLMNYSAWLARRWEDPAFPLSFPWFNTERYWAEHILELREQLFALDEPILQLI